jgi:hypothetical protein
MKNLTKTAATLVVAVGLAAGATTANAACKNFGAVGTGINESIAKYMADAALKNIRENAGYAKPSSATTYKCEAGMLATDCHAHQKACN